MEINNLINAGTMSNGWTSFTTSITGTITNPTKGTIIIDQSSYFILGKVIFIQYTYNQQGNSGSAGSGDYLFSIPSGYTIDTSLAPIYNASNNTRTALGSVITSNENPGIGCAFVYNSKNYGFFSLANGTYNNVGSSFQQIRFSNTGPLYSGFIKIPIL